jgi:hypothetical protein
MSEIQWVPGFIRLTRKTGVTYWIQIAEIICIDGGKSDGLPGSYIQLKSQTEERFVLETPEQIGELIRQAFWKAEIQRAVQPGEAT